MKSQLATKKSNARNFNSLSYLSLIEFYKKFGIIWDQAECIGGDTCCHDAEDCGGKLLLLTLADAVCHAEQPRDL